MHLLDRFDHNLQALPSNQSLLILSDYSNHFFDLIDYYLSYYKLMHFEQV